MLLRPVLFLLMLAAILVDARNVDTPKPKNKESPIKKVTETTLTDILSDKEDIKLNKKAKSGLTEESPEQKKSLQHNSEPIETAKMSEGSELQTNTEGEAGVTDTVIYKKTDELITEDKQEIPQAIIDLVPALFTTFLGNIGSEQKIMSVAQILFYHLLALSILYLLQVLILAFVDFIDRLRSPLLIYKEVDGYKDVKAKPAPKYPLPHKEYGYTGGFKTTKGEHIKYIPVQKPKHKPVHHEQKAVYHHEAKPVYHHESKPVYHHEPKPVYHHEAKPVYQHEHKATHYEPKPVYLEPIVHHPKDSSGYGKPSPHSVIEAHHDDAATPIHHPIKDHHQGEDASGSSSYVSYSGQKADGHHV